MFAPYHEKFLHHLLTHKVAFLFIGGQAKRLLDSAHQTRDLDIWVRITEETDLARLSDAVVTWIKVHPQHSCVNIAQPLNFRAAVQVKLPDADGVCFFDREGRVQSIDVADGIDLLTSLGDLDFDACLSRAITTNIGSIYVLSLCALDLKNAYDTS